MYVHFDLIQYFDFQSEKNCVCTFSLTNKIYFK